jgi:hypothetical protein
VTGSGMKRRLTRVLRYEALLPAISTGVPILQAPVAPLHDIRGAQNQTGFPRGRRPHPLLLARRPRR